MLTVWITFSVLTLIPQPKNVALNCPYSIQPSPNYPYCTDRDDGIQLTDGQYTQGYFWTQKSTVGWRNVGPVFIVVDLKRDVAISGVSFNTAAGFAGVSFPQAIWVLVSLDSKRWFPVGDLVQASNDQNGPPPSQGYAVHRFWIDRWRTHGRFVAFIIFPQGSFCFVDEIEVYEGNAERLAQPLQEGVEDLKAWAQRKEIERCAFRRLKTDLGTLRQIVGQAKLPETVKTDLFKRLDKLQATLPRSFPVKDPGNFSTVLPLNRWHSELFRIQAQLWRAVGIPAFTAFVASSPYDPLPYLTDSPVPKPHLHGEVNLVLLRNETRPIAINIVNARDRTVVVSVKVEGLSSSVTCEPHFVLWTDTKEGIPIAAALPEGDKFPVRSGMVGQAWMNFKPSRMTLKGEYNAWIWVTTDVGDKVKVALRLTFLPLTLPDRMSLHLGGWDYTDVDERYGVNPKNRDAFIAHLRERFVDIPWASRFVLPSGKFDEKGKMVEKPNTEPFDRWLNRWKGASRFYIFVNAGTSFEGSKVGTPEFERKVGEWISFWWRHAQKRGLKKGQFGVLLVDEPHTLEKDELTTAWAEVIKKAAPEVVIWVDPTWAEPQDMNPKLPELVDVLCPQRAIWLRNPKSHEEFYLKWRDKGKRLALYSCSGPSKLLDPYSYYRLQAWHCFAIGADEMFFWAFGDNAGNSCWNAYLDPRNCYTPSFLAPDSVTTAKQMEVIREGVQDYEILRILKDIATRSSDAGLLKLIQEGVRKVLAPIGVNELRWQVPKDRTLADRVRKEVLQKLLENLSNFRDLPIIW